MEPNGYSIIPFENYVEQCLGRGSIDYPENRAK